MRPKIKNTLIFIAILLVFISGIILVSLKESRKIAGEIEQRIGRGITGRPWLGQPRELVPDNPDNYDFVVTGDKSGLGQEPDWDAILFRKIRELKSQTPAQDWEKIKGKIEEDPQKTQDKLRQIDEGIKQCRELLSKEPQNQDVKDKLERLMILKALGKEFPRQI